MQQHEYDSERSLFILVKRTSRAFMRRLNHNFSQAGHDITTEQWRILRCLQRQDGQRQQDLANRVRKDKTSITRLIDCMEKRDLVVRIADLLDRRQKLIYLTNKGKRLQEELMGIVRETALEAQQNVEPEHLDTCRSVLTRIYGNLSDS